MITSQINETKYNKVVFVAKMFMQKLNFLPLLSEYVEAFSYDLGRSTTLIIVPLAT